MSEPGIDFQYGYIAFPQAELSAKRNGDGVCIILPTITGMRWSGFPHPRPMLSQIQCLISILPSTGNPIELGTAYDLSNYTPPKGGVDGIRTRLEWQVGFGTLALIERTRNGQAPRFQIEFSGVITPLRHTQDSSGNEMEAQSTPEPVVGQLRIRYSVDSWVAMRRRAGISHHVLLDIPFPETSPANWEPVWNHVLDAVTSFEQGGHVAWKNCVASVREALTEWSNLEHPDLTQSNSRDRTHNQRVDHLRHALRELAHLGVHGHAESWTRDDAVLALATLAGLLARRQP